MEDQVRLVIEEREAFHEWMSTLTPTSSTCILCASPCRANDVVCEACVASRAGSRVRYSLTSAQRYS